MDDLFWLGQRVDNKKLGSANGRRGPVTSLFDAP